MNQNILLAVVSVFSLAFQCRAYPSGPPLVACQNMIPQHRNRIVRNFGYDVVFPLGNVQPGGQFRLQLSGPLNFKGIFLQMRPEGNIDTTETVGQWNVDLSSNSRLYQTINCFKKSGSALGHNSGVNKITAAQEFVWMAPSDCDGKRYILLAMIVQSYTNIQTLIQKTITCQRLLPPPLPVRPSFQPPPPPSVTPSVQPPPPFTPPFQPPSPFTPPFQPPSPFIPPFQPPSPATQTFISLPSQTAGPICKFFAFNKIPSGYNVNFEESVNYLNGWKLSYNKTYRWERRNGYTPSFLTGPRNAFEGNFYGYVESSSPAQQNNRAILSTGKDFRGCFCLHLAVSHRIEQNSGHEFSVEVDGVPMLTIIDTSERWEERRIQVDDINFVDISIVAKRGSNWVGDFAIDNIRIIPGLCN